MSRHEFSLNPFHVLRPVEVQDREDGDYEDKSEHQQQQFGALALKKPEPKDKEIDEIEEEGVVNPSGITLTMQEQDENAP